jgi:hypothetical protein
VLMKKLQNGSQGSPQSSDIKREPACKLYRLIHFKNPNEFWYGCLEYQWRRPPFLGDYNSRIQVCGMAYDCRFGSPMGSGLFCEWMTPLWRFRRLEISSCIKSKQWAAFMPSRSMRKEVGVVVSSLVSRYTDGLQAGWPGFDSQQCKIFLFSSVQTDSGAHPASYPMGTGCSFPGGKGPGA